MTERRITINVTARAAAAISEIVELTGESKTDAINRAVLLYELVLRAQRDGGALYLRESGDGELERLRIF